MKTKLVAFDVDGTLIDGLDSIWPVIHDGLGACKIARKKAETMYFAGEISLYEWADHDVGLWKGKGATKDRIIDAISSLRLMNGAIDVLETLKKKGVKMAIVSGSLSIVLDKFIPNYKDYFDYVFVNHLYFDKDGKLHDFEANSGGASDKAKALKKIAEECNIDLKEIAFVGDQFNDVDAVKIAGTGISFNSRSKELDEVADIIVRGNDLREILKFIE